MDIDSRVLIETFHDPLRLGHYIVYKILDKERQDLLKQIMDDYKLSPMTRYELEKVFLSPQYLQLQFPMDKEESQESMLDHVARKRRMVSQFC